MYNSQSQGESTFPWSTCPIVPSKVNFLLSSARKKCPNLCSRVASSAQTLLPAHEYHLCLYRTLAAQDWPHAGGVEQASLSSAMESMSVERWTFVFELKDTSNETGEAQTSNFVKNVTFLVFPSSKKILSVRGNSFGRDELISPMSQQPLSTDL